jgi:hypothetical protein
MGGAGTSAPTVPAARMVRLTAQQRAVIVEALASALVEDYRAIPQSAGDSPTGSVREARPCV